MPKAILWEGRVYQVRQVGYHHTVRTGRTLYHVFSVTCDGLFFRIVCNTDTLSWEVEEIADGEVN